MALLQGQISSAGPGNPFVRVMLALLLIVISLVVLAIAIIVALVAIPLALVAWVLLSLRRLWTTRGHGVPEERVNVRVREHVE